MKLQKQAQVIANALSALKASARLDDAEQPNRPINLNDVIAMSLIYAGGAAMTPTQIGRRAGSPREQISYLICRAVKHSPFFYKASRGKYQLTAEGVDLIEELIDNLNPRSK